MNNKFIPILSAFMTISLVVFVSMQLYWLKEYYSALEQEFSNKVYSSMDQVREKAIDLEVDKFFTHNGDRNFLDSIRNNSGNATQQSLQVLMDTGGKQVRRINSFSKTILQKSDIPLTTKGDSMEVTNLYTDEGRIVQKNPVGPLSAKFSQDLSTNNFTLQQLVKINAVNMPIQKRISASELKNLIQKELAMKGINTPFGYAVLDKNNAATKITSEIYRKNEAQSKYNFELFSDGQFKTIFSLSLVFPNRNYALVQNNLPMLVGTMASLLIILIIYIISIKYMIGQKKVSAIKTDFINNMSHEFKTPLATISVATDSLSNDKIATNPDKVKYYSALIKQENLRMKKQVENVLNMSKLERNEMKLFLKSTDMQEIIKSIVHSFQLIIEQRHGSLETDFAAQKHVIKVDEFHISNALINLLDNANKYSPQTPNIKISTKNEGNWYVISISDKGIGMDAQNKDKIFEKFFREETGNIHNVKGQGLGLSYVKKIIEMHKGTISVTSEKGVGSTFTVKLPLTV